MLSIDDLDNISEFFTEFLSKTKKKVKDESNPKIVNFKIRSFLEKIKDLIAKFDEAPTTSHPPLVTADEFPQLERIEKTIAQLGLKLSNYVKDQY